MGAHTGTHAPRLCFRINHHMLSHQIHWAHSGMAYISKYARADPCPPPLIWITQAMVLATDRTGLYLYASLSAVAAIVAGVLAIFFLPLIHILLRCACGGFLVAVGINGIVESSTGSPLPRYVFRILVSAKRQERRHRSTHAPFCPSAPIHYLPMHAHITRCHTHPHLVGPSMSSSRCREPLVPLYSSVSRSVTL